MGKDEDHLYQQQIKIFERLLDRIGKLLERFGIRDSFGERGDFSILDDYWGHPQVRVSFHNLALLQPHVIKALQKIVKDFPGWEIVVVVAVRGHYDDWPDMGLYVRPDEIIDGLQRRYFPKELQNIEYEGSRRGTDRD